MGDWGAYMKDDTRIWKQYCSEQFFKIAGRCGFLYVQLTAGSRTPMPFYTGSAASGDRETRGTAAKPAIGREKDDSFG